MVQYVKKAAAGVHCGLCPKRIAGVPRLRPADFSRLPKSKRTVTRAYGGNLCPDCLKEKIMRAFIIEEQKIVKKVLLERIAAKKA